MFVSEHSNVFGFAEFHLAHKLYVDFVHGNFEDNFAKLLQELNLSWTKAEKVRTALVKKRLLCFPSHDFNFFNLLICF